jgi:hypothetical protein
MYKLVVVGGKMRGQEFILKPGDNVLGRENSCDIAFPSDGVSKKHVLISVTGDVVFAEDQGSANGTFVNGKLIKRISMQSGDRIGLPNAILQLVYVKEKVVVVKKKVNLRSEKEETSADILKGSQAPDNILGKIIWLFKYKFMPIVYGVNQEYEWRILLGALTAAYAVATISLTIFPVLEDSKTILLTEISNRGAHYAEEISRLNSLALEQHQLERIDTTFLDTEEGVASYELFDLEGRIIRPISRLNEYTNDPFSINTKEWALKNSDAKTVYKRILDNSQIGIGKKIMAYNGKTGNQEAVGVISIRFAPRTLAVEASNSSRAYLESVVTSLLVGIIFYGIVYFLTLRPLEEIRLQTEEGLRGKRRSLESQLCFEEMTPVRNAINATLQRIRELQRDETEIDPNEIESDAGYVSTLSEFMLGASGPTMVFNSQKNLIKINTLCEDLCGIRQSMAEGMNIMDITKERGLAATLIELCDGSANNGGTSQQGSYELQGKPYNIFVNSLMGKDNFAKAFYITFVLDS